MSAFLSLQRVSYATVSGQQLFDGLSLDFGLERSGLVGRNGIGKSTLLRLLDGSLLPGSGQVRCEGRRRMLRQTAAIESGTLIGAFGVAEAWARLRRIEQGEGGAEDLQQADWTLRARMEAALARIGLPDWPPDWPLAAMSGGQRTRVALAALIFDEPDFLLLDEPTNHLDREGREQVARLLQEWRGGAIVVSHDRELLERMDRIVELSTLGARIYAGNGSEYRLQKQAELAQAEQELGSAARKLKAVREGIRQARERKARRDANALRDRARGGQARILLDRAAERAEKTLGRGSHLAERQLGDARREVQQARAQLESLRPLMVEIDGTGLPQGRQVLVFEKVSGGPVDGVDVLRDISFGITGPERVAVVGRNGSGKSTLLKLAAGLLQPSRGRIERPLRAALLDQDVILLDDAQSLLENFHRLNPDDNEQTARDALARFLFRTDAALKKAGQLSGGERLRAGLACLLGSRTPPGLLLLDEPTNHLDLQSIEAVEAGLDAFDGALLVVSHDRFFLDAIGIQRSISLDPPERINAGAGGEDA
ncbi:MAG: ATP-binding cassette domain-containing protein [Xanthomonadaceae bacterium]|jgi:ATPase subunit of ABC transporter with duplicated ATPase domains|nr:ATP-binding cassette domain-containing protein [Xanthomonadaceae bacterium]